MAKLFLPLAILGACTAIYASGTFVNLLRVPPSEVVQQEGSTLSVVCQAASTDRNLEIQWYQITTEGVKLPVENFKVPPFKTKSTVVLKANIITIVTSTLTIERLSVVYVGAYACRAVAGDIKVDSDAFQVQVSGTTVSSTLPVTGGCMPPYIFSFGVDSEELFSNRTEVDLLLKWNAVNHNVNACIVTQWSVRYASWPSYLGLPESDFTAPPHAVWSQFFELPAIANSTSVAGLNRTNYHIFQLSADFETQPINKLVINSHIYYFQAQVPAKVVSPPVTIRAHPGSDVLFLCNVSGVPLPSVTWLKTISGHEDALAPPADTDNSDAGDYYKSAVFNMTLPSVGPKDSGVYKCMAQNKLVNPPRGMWEPTDWGTIVLEVA